MRLEDIHPAVITIVLIGLILGIGIFIISEVEENVYDATSTSAVNESVTNALINGTTGATLDAGLLRDGACGTITAIMNGTNGAVIPLNNITQVDCNIKNASTLVPYNTTLYFSYPYTYNADTEASDAMNTTVSGLGEFAGWISIIVVVIAAAIVLGIVLNSFGRKTPGV